MERLDITRRESRAVIFMIAAEVMRKLEVKGELDHIFFNIDEETQEIKSISLKDKRGFRLVGVLNPKAKEVTRLLLEQPLYLGDGWKEEDRELATSVTIYAGDRMPSIVSARNDEERYWLVRSQDADGSWKSHKRRSML